MLLRNPKQVATQDGTAPCLTIVPGLITEEMMKTEPAWASTQKRYDEAKLPFNSNPKIKMIREVWSKAQKEPVCKKAWETRDKKLNSVIREIEKLKKDGQP